MPLPVGSPQLLQKAAQAMPEAAGNSETHCGCLSSLQRLHLMTEIKHLARSWITFKNYILMIAT